MFLIVPLLAMGMASFTPATSAETVVDTCESFADVVCATTCPDPEETCIHLRISDEANNSFPIADTEDPVLLAQAVGRLKEYRWGTIHVAHCAVFTVEALGESFPSPNACAMAGGDFVKDREVIFDKDVELPSDTGEKCRVGLYDAYLTARVEGTGLRNHSIGQVAKPEDLSECMTRISVADPDPNANT